MFAKVITLTGLCLAFLMLQTGAEQHDTHTNGSKYGQNDIVKPKGEIRDIPIGLIGAAPVSRKQTEISRTNPDGSIVTMVFNDGEDIDFSLLDSAPVRLSSELTWHVGVYTKYRKTYMQICGGTLVTTKAVISAAHCFWREPSGLLPAANFAVAAGKNHRLWNDTKDPDSQKSKVEVIHVPPRYRGDATNFQEDIAVLLLATEMETNVAVKPACVDFGEEFDDEQLLHGNLGTILGWGLTEEDGKPSPVLNYLEVPAVDLQECLAMAEPGFLRYITSDKICAGGIAGKAMCRGDSGGGLVFFSGTGQLRVPYLRGVASTAPRNEHACNAQAPSALTHVRAHRAFLRKHIPDLEAECKKHFKVSEELQDRTASVQPAADKPIQCVCNCFCNKDPAPSQEGPIIFRH